MPTIGMTNVQDTPSAGPLKAEELSMYWPPRRAVPSIEQPAPAEASTDLGQDDDLDAARGVVYCIPAAILAWAVISALAIAAKLWFF